jgi:hypothetical protein
MLGVRCGIQLDGEECDEPAWWESLDHVYVISFHGKHPYHPFFRKLRQLGGGCPEETDVALKK